MSLSIQTPTAAVIIIGNEILSGRTKDTNLNYAALGLAEIGVRLKEARVVPDILSAVVAAVNECRANYDYVFTSGGIGPTHDDITSECIAAAFGCKVALHDEAAKILNDYYKENITPARLRMAMLPENTDELITNPISSAPGYRIGNVYVMAGVPKIFQAMFDWVKPKLKGGVKIESRAVSAYMPESMLADALTALQNKYQAVDIGSYPQMQEGKVAVTIVARGTDAAMLEEVIAEVAQAMRQHTQQIIAGELV